MSIKAGLVGLPNVGKSTLFNALTKSSIPAENYPFCTIDPHVAITQVPDTRLDELQKIYGSGKQIPATVTFVDIAGLVKGAASGEGLGNQFLSHIREVDLILHVLRCFEDPDITHAGDTIDPITDYEIIISELILKDLESITKRLARIEKDIKRAQGPEKKELEAEQQLLKQLYPLLDAEKVDEAHKLYSSAHFPIIPLLSVKKSMIIANIAESDLEDDAYKKNNHYQTLIAKFGQDRVIPVSVKAEYELSQADEKDIPDMMALIGLQERGVDSIIQKTYKNLGLITFFTCGPQEAHAWPIPRGTTVREAAGEIHSDLQRGFICAEVFNYKDIAAYRNEVELKNKGLIRREGQDYLVQDGDLLNIRFNV